MDPMTAAIAASAASSALNIGGDLFQQHTAYSQNKHLAEKQFYYNSALMEKQNQYNKETMQNKYQWAMDDMKKAGLNPTLMMGGAAGNVSALGTSGIGTSGASAPAVATERFTSALRTAKELSLMDAEREKIKSETDLNNNTSGKTEQETLYLMENTKKVRADIENTLANSRLSEAQRQETMEKIDVLLKEEQKISEEIKNLEKQGEILDVQKAFARAEAIQRQITGYVDSAVGVANAVKGTSALPMNIHSKGASAVYHQPGNLW